WIRGAGRKRRTGCWCTKYETGTPPCTLCQGNGNAGRPCRSGVGTGTTSGSTRRAICVRSTPGRQQSSSCPRAGTSSNPSCTPPDEKTETAAAATDLQCEIDFSARAGAGPRVMIPNAILAPAFLRSFGVRNG
ncbi:unnamed protein product, partial [Amoebophrya sp. A120]